MVLLSVTYLVLDVPYGTWLCIFMNIKSRINILLFIVVVVTSMGITANQVRAETGKGEDIFKEILQKYSSLYE